VTHVRTQHPNAPLTPEGTRRMVECVLDHGWTIEMTAERFQVDAKTDRKWRDRFLAAHDAKQTGRESGLTCTNVVGGRRLERRTSSASSTEP
jgi:transposase-like protein